MFNQEFNCQNIFKQESSKIANAFFFSSKNQSRFSIFLFIPSKNQARQRFLERINQDRDENFDTKKLEIKSFKQVLLFSDLRNCWSFNFLAATNLASLPTLTSSKVALTLSSSSSSWFLEASLSIICLCRPFSEGVSTLVLTRNAARLFRSSPSCVAS